MTQKTVKKLREWYQIQVGMLHEKSTIRWDWWLRLWLVLFIVLLVFLLHNLQTGGLPAIVTILLPPSPPVTIVARNDLPAFTVLTREKIAIQQGNQEQNPSPQDTLALKEQEEAIYQRITLRSYNKGEKIQLSDLGPRLPATHHYQVREIRASTSLTWIRVGDTLAFTLVNTACPSEAATAKTSVTCERRPTSSPPLLKDVVIIQEGKTSQNGLVALLVAIPLEENTDSVAFLNAGSSSIVAYPAANITGISTTKRSLIT